MSNSDCFHPNYIIKVTIDDSGLYHFSCPDCSLGMWAPQDEMLKMGWIKIADKARQQVDGWPRGRSTSRPSMFSSKWHEDRADYLAEERRKADMMEVFYEQKRMEARGKLRPQTAGEALMAHVPGYLELTGSEP